MNFIDFNLKNKKKSFPIIQVVRIPVRAYTPGQMINVEIYVNNQSRQSIAELSVELIRVRSDKVGLWVEYHLQIRFSFYFQGITYFKSKNSNIRKLERISIVRTKTYGCGKYQDRTILVDLPVPSIPPSDFISSSIMHVRYCMRVSFVLFPDNGNPCVLL